MSFQDRQSDERAGSLWLPILISIGVALFLMTLMPTTQFWDRDEGYYARVAIEMTRSGNWILPTYNDAVFPDKPPLIYWLMAVFMRIFGENEFGARFVSAPATGFSSFFIFLIGNRMFSRKAGLYAMLAFATSTLTIYLGITAMLDALLVAFICLTLWIYLTILQSPERFWLKAAAFGLSLGFAMLTKGPVGPAIVIPCVALTWFFLPQGERPAFQRMAVLAVAAILGFGMLLAWEIPANSMSDDEMVIGGIGVHVIGRALAPMQSHGGSGFWGYLATLPAYIPVIFIGFMPSTLFLPSVLSALWRRTGVETLPRLFLLSWMFPGFILFSLAATKLPHYMEPLFPPMALGAGALIAGHLTAGNTARNIGRWLYILMIGGLAAALVAAMTFAKDGLVLAALAVGVIVVLGFGFRISLAQRKGQYETALMAAAISVVLLMEPLFLVVIPRLETAIKVSKPVADLIRADVKPGTPVYDAGYLEPSLVFYLGWPVESPIRDLDMSAAGLKSFLEAPGERVVVATQDDFDTIQAADGQKRLEKLGSFAAWNTNASGKFQVVVVARVKP